MIGPRIRLALRVMAWAIIATGLATVALSLVDVFPGTSTYPPGQERLILSAIYYTALPVVVGGVLLVLLSIDERIQNRGA